MTNREKIIGNYIEGYNAFDIDKMVKDLDDAVCFENISNGELNMTLIGLEAFKQQALAAMAYFATRTQTLKSFKHEGDKTEVEIRYAAVLATDLPNGLKKGETLTLNGKSIFTFSGDKIIKIRDIS